MATTAASIIAKASQILLDSGNVRWTTDELLGWLNEAQKQIVIFKPNAYVKSSAVQLVAGTRQSLPDDGVQLINVVRNMGTTGSVPGVAVRFVTRETLDAQLPTWHSYAASNVAKHYLFSTLDPKHYYVFPPQPAANTGFVELVYGAVPPDATAGGSINVDDIYASPMLDWILYRAFSKDTEFAADQGRSASHLQAFTASLSGKAGAESGTTPEVTSTAPG